MWKYDYQANRVGYQGCGHARKSGEWGGGGYRRQASRQGGSCGQATHSRSEDSLAPPSTSKS